jgi:hypothetical protein
MNFNGAVESVRRLSDRGYRFMIVIRTCAGIALIVGATNYASAQQAWLPAGDQRIQSTHSIDNELDRIAMTLQLSQQRCSEVSALLQQHHVRILAPIDGNPSASDEFLRKRIHSISDDTHRPINTLLGDRQLVLVRQRQEGRRRYIDSVRNC